MTKLTRILAGLALAGASFGTTRAMAGSWTLQAASGHPFNGTGLGGLIMSDGSMRGPPDGVNRNWVVHVPLSVATATTYTGTQYYSASFGLGTVCSRLVSFNSNGTVSGLPACTTSTAANALTAVTVPANGTLFISSGLLGNVGGVGVTLHGFKVTY